MLVRMPVSVRSPLQGASRSAAVMGASCSRSTSIWFLAPAGMAALNTAMAASARPGWATQVPSWPLLASRSLSAFTLANTCSFTAGSFAGIKAAMPPMASAPRLWQVLISRRE
ncbi:hypothetical protein D3C78_1579700 [compost metagenome]